MIKDKNYFYFSLTRITILPLNISHLSKSSSRFSPVKSLQHPFNISSENRTSPFRTIQDQSNKKNKKNNFLFTEITIPKKNKFNSNDNESLRSRRGILQRPCRAEGPGAKPLTAPCSAEGPGAKPSTVPYSNPLGQNHSLLHNFFSENNLHSTKPTSFKKKSKRYSIPKSSLYKPRKNSSKKITKRKKKSKKILTRKSSKKITKKSKKILTRKFSKKINKKNK